MNKIYVFILLSILFLSARAEKVTIFFQMSNIPPTSNLFMVHDKVGLYNPQNKETLEPDKNGRDDFTLDVKSPQFFKLDFIVNQYNPTYIPYLLYLTPGDQLIIKVDFAKKGHEISVSGRGSRNNQPYIQGIVYFNLQKYMPETLPYKVLTIIKKQQIQNKTILNSYIKKYKPSTDFITTYERDLSYFPIANYYSFKEENKLYTENTYARNSDKWNNVQQELMKSAKPNNDSALSGYFYVEFISTILLRQIGTQITLLNENLTAFNKKWYPNGDNKKGLKFTYEQDNIFALRIININFTGKTKEFLHFRLIRNNLYNGNYKNIGILYSQFAKEYPTSKYLKSLQMPVTEALTRGNN